MSSLPESYRPTLQTITAAERTNAALGILSKKMKADDLVAFLIEEAQHRVINDDRTKSAESALAAHGKRDKRGRGDKGKKADKSGSGRNCENCHKPYHTKENCWAKGGGKEGQGPKQNKSKTVKRRKCWQPLRKTRMNSSLHLPA